MIYDLFQEKLLTILRIIIINEAKIKILLMSILTFLVHVNMKSLFHLLYNPVIIENFKIFQIGMGGQDQGPVAEQRKNIIRNSYVNTMLHIRSYDCT